MSLNTGNQLVTASVDNILCFWNSFTGVESKKLVLPDDIANAFRGQKIAYISFPFPHQKDLLFIALNTGDCFILDTQSERFVEFPRNGLGPPDETAADQAGGLGRTETLGLQRNVSIDSRATMPAPSGQSRDKKKALRELRKASVQPKQQGSRNYRLG